SLGYPALAPGREMEAGRAVDAVAIEQRERRIAERRGAVDERLGKRGAVEKRKRGSGVKLDIHGGTSACWFRVPVQGSRLWFKVSGFRLQGSATREPRTGTLKPEPQP